MAKKQTIHAKKMAAQVVQNKALMLELLEKHSGNVSEACDAAGLGRTSHYTYLDDPEYALAVESVEERRIDRSEGELQKKIKEGFWPAIQFDLLGKGKRRGHTPRTEVTGGDGKPLLVVRYQEPTKEDTNEKDS
jgi:hypothetical protein